MRRYALATMLGGLACLLAHGRSEACSPVPRPLKQLFPYPDQAVPPSTRLVFTNPDGYAEVFEGSLELVDAAERAYPCKRRVLDNPAVVPVSYFPPRLFVLEPIAPLPAGGPYRVRWAYSSRHALLATPFHVDDRLPEHPSVRPTPPALAFAQVCTACADACDSSCGSACINRRFVHARIGEVWGSTFGLLILHHRLTGAASEARFGSMDRTVNAELFVPGRWCFAFQWLPFSGQPGELSEDRCIDVPSWVRSPCQRNAVGLWYYADEDGTDFCHPRYAPTPDGADGGVREGGLDGGTGDSQTPPPSRSGCGVLIDTPAPDALGYITLFVLGALLRRRARCAILRA